MVMQPSKTALTELAPPTSRQEFRPPDLSALRCPESQDEYHEGSGVSLLALLGSSLNWPWRRKCGRFCPEL